MVSGSPKTVAACSPRYRADAKLKGTRAEVTVIRRQNQPDEKANSFGLKSHFFGGCNLITSIPEESNGAEYRRF